jgi:hypothetical protein
MDGVTPHPAGRENGAGMVTPDTRPYDALEQVARFTHETGMGIFPLWDPLIYAPCPHHGLRVLGARGIDLLMEPDPDAAQADFLAGGRPLFVLVCHQDEDPLKALARGMGVNLNPLSRKLVAPVLARHKEVLFTAADPYANQFLGDIEYSVVRIDPR